MSFLKEIHSLRGEELSLFLDYVEIFNQVERDVFSPDQSLKLTNSYPNLARSEFLASIVTERLFSQSSQDLAGYNLNTMELAFVEQLEEKVQKITDGDETCLFSESYLAYRKDVVAFVDVSNAEAFDPIKD